MVERGRLGTDVAWWDVAADSGRFTVAKRVGDSAYVSRAAGLWLSACSYGLIGLMEMVQSPLISPGRIDHP